MTHDEVISLALYQAKRYFLTGISFSVAAGMVLLQKPSGIHCDSPTGAFHILHTASVSNRDAVHTIAEIRCSAPSNPTPPNLASFNVISYIWQGNIPKGRK